MSFGKILHYKIVAFVTKDTTILSGKGFTCIENKEAIKKRGGGGRMSSEDLGVSTPVSL